MSCVLAPSILAADFARLADAAAAVEGVADWLHVDVMDNHFVPNLTLGAPVVQDLARSTTLPLDCHLMITDVDRWGPGYADVGAASVTFHVEASNDPVTLARAIRARGARAGFAVKPGTPIEPYAELIGEVDLVLVMTVEPGFGGQDFRSDMLPKVQAARRLVRARDGHVWIQVDGGVDPDTIEQCAAAGADAFVAGSAVYGADDPAEAVRQLRKVAEAALAGTESS